MTIARMTRIVVTVILWMISAIMPVVAAPTDEAAALGRKAHEFSRAGKYADAIPLAERALALREKVLGPNHPDVALSLNNLAHLYKEQGRYSDAEPLFQRSLAIREKALGRDHPDVAQSLNNLAVLYADEGHYADAEPLYQRSLAIREKALGRDHPDVAQSLTNLAYLYKEQGRYSDAEPLLQRALATSEKALGRDHPNVATSLNVLASIYTDEGRYADAEPLYKRALAIREKALGRDHPNVATSLNNLAELYRHQGRYAEAEPLYQRSLAVKEKALGPDHLDVATALNNLAFVYKDQGSYSEAEAHYKRALAIDEDKLGKDHPKTASTITGLANVYRAEGKYADAEALYKRALTIREEKLSRDHPVLALTYYRLATFYEAQDKYTDALVWSRKAAAAVIAHAQIEGKSTSQKGAAASIVEEGGNYLHDYAAILYTARERGIEPEAKLSREGFETAQWAVQSSAGAALAQMAAREAKGAGELAQVVRERQDLERQWHVASQQLTTALGRGDVALASGLRNQLSGLEAKFTDIDTRLARQFPDYAELSNPKALAIADAQALLGPDEALLFWFVNNKESYVFALTRDSFDWKAIPLGADALAQKVAVLRRGLDVDPLLRGNWHGLFDLGLAYELYASLIGPVETLIHDKRHLMVVSSGALTALPFHLLVTEKPALGIPPVKTARDLTAYRDAAWLLKRHAVSVLPSVASLKALRVFARKAQAKNPLIGFGDPIFNPEEENRLAKQEKVVVATRSYPEFWKGVEIDRGMLRGLPRLPETADELKVVAAKLGAPMSDIHLQRDASETTVKRTRLDEYSVLYFATHGLVAGDVKGLGEPALALSIPKQPSEIDDGLLTASEVAQLKLNADWVVLSACNTAAGDKPGAEALSGLARAFFYAGARALLVSHWAVESKAATTLTTSTFDILKSDPKLGRAEALRRAMLTYMNASTDPLSAYPALWAPFVVVGEGAAQ